MKTAGTGFEMVDITNGLAATMTVKDAKEIKTARKAAKIVNKTMQSKFKEEMETIVDKGDKITHAKVSSKVSMFEECSKPGQFCGY